jgi:hypothetical protein
MIRSVSSGSVSGHGRATHQIGTRWPALLAAALPVIALVGLWAGLAATAYPAHGQQPNCGYYRNSNGHEVPRPCGNWRASPRAAPPNAATALCGDGTYSYSEHPMQADLFPPRRRNAASSITCGGPAASGQKPPLERLRRIAALSRLSDLHGLSQSCMIWINQGRRHG